MDNEEQILATLQKLLASQEQTLAVQQLTLENQQKAIASQQIALRNQLATGRIYRIAVGIVAIIVVITVYFILRTRG